MVVGWSMLMHRRSQCRFRTFDRTHRTPPFFTSRTWIKLLLTRMDPFISSSLPASPLIYAGCDHQAQEPKSLELGDQPCLCLACDLVAAAMGTKIPPGHPVALTLQSTQTSTYSLRSLPKGSRSVSFRGRSKHYPRFSTFSLFLFFAGLIVFLSNADVTIFKFVLS